MPRRSADIGQAGFTLLEVLVAFIIAAMALSVLYRGAIDGILSVRVATQYEDAISRARSRLAAIGHGSAIVPGEQSGDDGGGFRWHTVITTRQTALPPPGLVEAGTQLPTLFAISVAVSWGVGETARSLQLDTQRVGFTLPQGP